MTRTWRRGKTQSTGYTILVVDGQEEILISTRLLLEREDHTVLTATVTAPQGETSNTVSTAA